MSASLHVPDAADALTLAFLDRRQYHPGHLLVIPRPHVPAT